MGMPRDAIFVEVFDAGCAAAEADGRFLAQAANFERGRRLEDAERHRRILHGAKKRVRAEGKAEGFAEGKAEGMQQAMKELDIWDKGFQEGRASAGTSSKSVASKSAASKNVASKSVASKSATSKSGRSEQLRIEAPAQWTPPPPSGSAPREPSILASRAFTQHRSIAMSAISRADASHAPSSRPAHHHPG